CRVVVLFLPRHRRAQFRRYPAHIVTAVDRYSRLAFARMYKSYSSLTAADLRNGMPFLEMLPALDYIVERERMRFLTSVRPSFRGNQATQLIAYSDAFLANHAAVRVWPVSVVAG